MGRDYGTEVNALPDTYREAVSRKYVAPDIEAFRATISHPLVASGVGGSIAAAELAAALQRDLTRLPARVATTLQLAEEGVMQSEACMIVTASGRNKDVLGAFDAAVSTGASELLVVTANPDSPIAVRANDLSYPHVFNVECSTRKDGFLATNTLLASCVHLVRLWAAACRIDLDLPATLSDLLGGSLAEARKNVDEQAAVLAGRSIFLVLYAGTGATGAVDFEARVNEGGLGTVHLADARMFAHGRHNWLASQLNDAAVIAFTDDSRDSLMRSTLKLIPKTVPQIVVDSTADSAGRLKALVSSILLTEALGNERGINPGKPTVGQWGRAVYSLGPKGVKPTHSTDPKVPAAPTRKPSATKQVGSRRIVKGLVLDVDGTILERRDRANPPPAGIMSEINRLLSEGCVVGFATGRGKSLHNQIFKGHIDMAHADKVVLGYYNGSVIQSVKDAPPGAGPTAKALKQLRKALDANNKPSWFEVEERPTQLCVNPYNPGNSGQLLSLVQALVHELDLPVAYGQSTLGLDVFEASAGKPRVVEVVAKKAGIKTDEVLRVGDMGAINGNDYPILNHAAGYSVWMTTPHNAAGHSAAPGLRGPKATQAFLKALQGPGKRS